MINAVASKVFQILHVPAGITKDELEAILFVVFQTTHVAWALKVLFLVSLSSFWLKDIAWSWAVFYPGESSHTNIWENLLELVNPGTSCFEGLGWTFFCPCEV